MLSPALCIRHPPSFRMPAGINGLDRYERTQKDKQSSLFPTRQAAGQATAIPASHAANPKPSCRSLSPAPLMPDPLAKSLKPSRRPSHSRTSKPRLLILAQTIMHARCRRQGRPCHSRCQLAAAPPLPPAAPPLPPFRPRCLLSRPTGLPPPRPPMSARCRAALAAGRNTLADAPPATPYSSTNRLGGLDTFQTEVMSTRVAVQNKPSNTLRASTTDARSDGCKNRTATRGSLSTSAPK